MRIKELTVAIGDEDLKQIIVWKEVLGNMTGNDWSKIIEEQEGILNNKGITFDDMDGLYNFLYDIVKGFER